MLVAAKHENAVDRLSFINSWLCKLEEWSYLRPYKALDLQRFASAYYIANREGLFKMFKVKIVIAVALLNLFVLAACGSTSDNNADAGDNVDNGNYVDAGGNAYIDDNIYIGFIPSTIQTTIIFEEPTVFDISRHGTEMVAVAGVRRYQFPASDEGYNLALASQFETAFYMFNEFLDAERRLSIIFTQDEALYSVRSFGGQHLALNPYDPATYGWFIYSMTMGAIPMWLSVGMEMAARGIDFDYPLGGLCDMYFAPFAWGSAENRQPISTAYHFVNYLIGNEYLAEIITLYLADDWNAANRLATERFNLFTGYDLDTFLRIQFSGTSYSVTANTYMAYYSFDFPQFHYHLEWPVGIWELTRAVLDIDYMDNARLMRTVDYLEDTILFVKNWYAEFVDFDFFPIETRIPMEIRTFAAAPGAMIIPINGMAAAAAHEVSHIISTQMLDGIYFIPFEEGLAEVVHIAHMFFDRDRHGWAYQIWPEDVDDTISALYEFGIFDSYAEATAVRALAARAFMYDDYEHYFAFSHFLAYATLNAPPYEVLRGRMRRWFTGPTYVNSSIELYTYFTSVSFVRYLIERYGPEKYMQVHVDVSRFEYVYGIALYEMVQEWLEFLSINAEEFLLAAMSQ